jgi:hypothetical protein
MGGQQSTLSPEELEEYQDCTFFTKKEILHVHRKFRELAGTALKPDEKLPMATVGRTEK